MDINNLLIINNQNNFDKISEEIYQANEFSFSNLIDQDEIKSNSLIINNINNNDNNYKVKIIIEHNDFNNLYSDQNKNDHHVDTDIKEDDKIVDQNLPYPDYLILYLNKYIENYDQIDNSYHQHSNEPIENVSTSDLSIDDKQDNVILKNILNKEIYRQELPIESIINNAEKKHTEITSDNQNSSEKYSNQEDNQTNLDIKTYIEESEAKLDYRSDIEIKPDSNIDSRLSIEKESNFKIDLKSNIETKPDFKPNVKTKPDSNIDYEFGNNQVSNIVKNSDISINDDYSAYQKSNNYNLIDQEKTNINDKQINLYEMIEDKNIEIILNPIDNNITKTNDQSSEIEIFDIDQSIDDHSIDKSTITQKPDNDKEFIDHNDGDNNADNYDDNEEPKEYIFESSFEKFNDNEILLRDNIIKDSKLQIDNKISMNNMIRQEIREQIKINLIKSVNNNESEIKILLNPENLGKLEIKLDSNDNKLNLSILSDNKETLSIIKQDIKQLEYDLSKIGINIEEYNLNLNSNNSENQNQHNRNNHELYEYENIKYNQDNEQENIVDNYLLKLESHYVANDSLDIKI